MFMGYTLLCWYVILQFKNCFLKEPFAMKVKMECYTFGPIASALAFIS